MPALVNSKAGSLLGRKGIATLAHMAARAKGDLMVARAAISGNRRARSFATVRKKRAPGLSSGPGGMCQPWLFVGLIDTYKTFPRRFW